MGEHRKSGGCLSVVLAALVVVVVAVSGAGCALRKRHTCNPAPTTTPVAANQPERAPHLSTPSAKVCTR